MPDTDTETGASAPARDAASVAAPDCRFLEAESEALAAWCLERLEEGPTPFDSARRIARRLGAHPAGDLDGAEEAGWASRRWVAFGFWAPEVLERRIAPDDVFLEILTPLEPLDLRVGRKEAGFRRQRLPVVRAEEFCWAAVDGPVIGDRDTVGSFYQLRFRDSDGVWRAVPDYVAYSVPYGGFAPAEIYDVARLDRERGDRAYWESVAGKTEADGALRLPPAVDILQLHTRTASAAGTIQGLTRIYRVLADKIRNGQPLAVEEQPYAGYDAIQLLPTEPIIEYESGPRFWRPLDEPEPDAFADPLASDDAADDGAGPAEGEVTIALRRPDMTNWGYDILIHASSAINPAILETGRPDELVDLAVTLHTFPERPIKLIFDVVYGHADNQAVGLISRHFFAGPNMYGQDIAFRHPVVRALMLEMQRRKGDFGCDGVRVDGAQDFRWWDADAQVLRHDDEYLQSMADVTQEVAGRRYRPWMVFEDGRPWPRPDWELSSTYRAVIENQGGPESDVYQWGPLTFAHNTPFLFTFWASKWWRLKEIERFGANWISGCANHDTLRRGYQVDPEKGINTRLGSTLQEIIDNAYDNPAANLLFYGFLPGTPMDFINAAMRASWAFIRNTDDKYGVKVVSEETGFLDWQVDEAHFGRPGNFSRLKAMGFDELDELRRFMQVLKTAVEVTDYDLDAIVKVLNAVEAPLSGPERLTVPVLKRIARAWMDDLHDYCNIAYYKASLSETQTLFNLHLRRFRMDRPWLRRNLGGGDVFSFREPVDGSVLFYGRRHGPKGEQLLFVAHMEGAPTTVSPLDLPIADLPRDGWRQAFATPGFDPADPTTGTEIHDGQGLILARGG
ncbi:MAG: glucosylglycerol hydrolase [Azospirillaceae bacterium]